MISPHKLYTGQVTSCAKHYVLHNLSPDLYTKSDLLTRHIAMICRLVCPNSSVQFILFCFQVSFLLSLFTCADLQNFIFLQDYILDELKSVDVPLPKVITTEFSSSERFVQHAKKVVFSSLGLVNFAIGLVDSLLNLPDRLVKFFLESILLIENPFLATCS